MKLKRPATPLSVNGDRVCAEIQELSQFMDGEPPGVTRVVFTEADRQARAWLRAKCVNSGLVTREDGVGNFFARWVGSEANTAAVGTGSHCDAIPNSGVYDGTVGVLGGLEAIRTLQESGFKPRRSIELLMFTSEEPTRFGIGCLGSRLLSGRADIGSIDRLLDGEEMSVREAARQSGFNGDLENVCLSSNYYSHFVELHIEQGPVLECESIPIGVVTAIAAPAALRIMFKGEGGHAGTVLMSGRHDALTAAAELALEVERAGRESESADTVATTGVFRPFPGAVNSIPSQCLLEIDVRDTSEKSRNRAVDRIVSFAHQVAGERGVDVLVETINSDPPAVCDTSVVEAVQASASAESLATLDLVSRAYHDSLFMATLTRTGMIFIPCRNGISHRPEEYATPEHICGGVAVLARTLAALSLSEEEA